MGEAIGGERVSGQLERWLHHGPRTLGSLVDLFGEKSFAVAFIVLMAVPALPLPTGGATHVLELITMLLALELVAGRRSIWLPERWKGVELGGAAGERFANALVTRIRFAERHSRPRLQRMLEHRASGRVFGLVVFMLAFAAFIAPPFSGLDTLPALGAVLVALGFLLEDILLAIAGIVVGILGAALVIAIGGAVLHLLGQLF
jgi:hypothetical protein